MTSVNEYQELIPEYLNGQLDRETARAFETALEADPELGRELEEYRQLRRLVKSTGSEPDPSPALFERILETLEETPAPEPQPAPALGPARPFRETLEALLERFRSSLVLPWSLALAQAAVIAILLIPSIPESTYHTLGLVREAVETEYPSLNIVFSETARETEIRTLLLAVNASIASGPSAQGRYRIIIQQSGDPTAVMTRLRSSELVRFVETAY